MKLLALNIQHGGGKRTAGIVEYLLRQDADALVLTEFRENANAVALRSSLGEAGFEHSSCPRLSPRQNSVSLFSRLPLTPSTCEQLPDTDRQRLILVKLEALYLAGVYFAQGDKKAGLFKFLVEQDFPARKEPFLILGDFNTGLHYADEQGATFACTSDFEHLLHLGYHDSWRQRNPELREFSWYSAHGNGFRIDHAFTNNAADAMVTEIHYDHEPRDKHLTDHSALIVELAANSLLNRTQSPLNGLRAGLNT